MLSNWNITGMIPSTLYTLVHNLKSSYRCFADPEMRHGVCYPDHLAKGGRGGIELRFPESKSWQCLAYGVLHFAS